MNHVFQTALMALVLPVVGLAAITVYELFSKEPANDLPYPGRLCRPKSKAKASRPRKG